MCRRMDDAAPDEDAADVEAATRTDGGQQLIAAVVAEGDDGQWRV